MNVSLPIRLEYLIGYKGPDPALAMIKQGLAPVTG